MKKWLYKEYKKDIMNNKNEPYQFVNRDLAKEIYENLRSEHIDASIYECSVFCEICITNEARRELLKRLNNHIRSYDACLSLYKSAAHAVQLDLNTER